MSNYCVVWQRQLLHKLLIISSVGICSKPMAILLYDDFYVCVFAMFVLACHRGLLEGYYFFIDLYMCEKLRSLMNWRREAETWDVKGKRTKGDERKGRKVRSCVE